MCVGRPVVKFNFSMGDVNTYTDPFGNRTTYSFASQAYVMARTTQQTLHTVYRSVSSFVNQQQVNARVNVKYGVFFKASAKTKWAQTMMSDSLHIVAESSCELGLYDITLSAPKFLQPDPQFEEYVVPTLVKLFCIVS